MNLFENNIKKYAPLADRMRPNTLEEFVGQTHLIYKNSFLNKAISMGALGSCIFYGPPGTGKTTLANIIANTCNGIFKKLNAISSGVADAKKIIEEARANLELYGTKTYLLLDECHRWNKAQSDCVLQAIEEGSIIFIGSTTENPYINMTRAIVSRCRVFEFKKLNKEDVKKAILNALSNVEHGYGNYKINLLPEALDMLAWASDGDVRCALNALELAFKTTTEDNNGVKVITKECVEDCMQKKFASLDETTYYDTLSAFCKSLRGSDTDAALYYAQRMLVNGVDPLIIARRMIAHASEDIGMADSNALLLANAALNAVQNLGMPECNLALSHAIIYICEAEKSNSVYLAMSKANEDALNQKHADVPNHLKNHPTGYSDGHGKYKYPHEYGGYVNQQYLPDALKDRVYYVPKNNGREAGLMRKKDKFNK